MIGIRFCLLVMLDILSVTPEAGKENTDFDSNGFCRKNSPPKPGEADALRKLFCKTRGFTG